MSKANQKFVQADEAVSPVIGVILMVAITVVLAAVVFVLVSNLSKGTGEANEAASVTASSPESNRIYLTLVKEGSNGPYNFTTNAGTSEVIITVDGNFCDQPNNSTAPPAGLNTTSSTGDGYHTDSDGNGDWDTSETIKLYTDCRVGGGALAGLVSGSTHLVSVTLHGTLILDNARVTIN